MAPKAEANAAPVPAAIDESDGGALASISCLIAEAPARNDAGTERKIENRAASSRVNPRSNPPVMMEAERAQPGTNATACHSPTHSASSKPTSSSVRRLAATRSTANITTASTMSAHAMIHADWSLTSMDFLKSAPKTATGTVATPMHRASLVRDGCDALPAAGRST